MVEQVVVGIDVSKARLDVAILPGGEQFTVSNDRLGIGELVRRLRPLAPSRVVLEATGKLEQLAVSELAAAGMPVVGRVAPGNCSPEAPTDPDVQISRIRLFGPRLRYVMVEKRMRGCGSG